MKQSLILILPILLAAESCASLLTGDLALIAWDSTAQGGLSFLVLADIDPDQTIFFTDNEPNGDGTGFNDQKEGTLQLTTGPSTITAGTVIQFTDQSSNSRSSNVGSLSEAESRFALSPSRDGLWVYQTGNNEYGGPMDSNSWISATASAAGFGTSDVGTIPTSSDLEAGFNALDLTPNHNTFEYTGDRSIPRSQAEWLAELSNPANFASGYSGSTASFGMVPEPGTVLPLAALLAPWFLHRRRR